MVKMTHSYWAYLVLLIIIVAIINAFVGMSSKKSFQANDLKLSLWALIAAHIQLIIGIIAFFMSDLFAIMQEIGMGEVMKNAEYRKALVEHPLVGIIAIVLITVGFSKHKKKTIDQEKFKTIALFYGVALILILSRIPWTNWFNN